ncbi:MAG TPA: peptidylprolyl isomerase [Deltaproteobacteria bacterium]|nr:peptidylprolyl isomerase [Deltaproteobacteria bacterium]HOI07521.1 peptidylprolyl isomerase [Deltaproteobacteria bacterium]
MEKAKKGDTVKVNYTGRSEDGTVFESSVGLTPLVFTIGSDEVVQGFEEAVVGMHPGEKKTVVVQPEDGFGMYDEDLVFEVGKDELPEDFYPQVGMDFEMVDEEGQELSATIIEVHPDSVLVDANAPLAGKSVVYEIELLEIVPGKRPLKPANG